jgi:hypothetical protein
MPAMTTAFRQGPQRRPRLCRPPRAMAHRKRLHRHRLPGLARRSRHAALRRKDRHPQDRGRSSRRQSPVVAAISALSTAEAVELAKAAHAAGCSGLMILPPYVYKGDWRENKAHVAAILKATPLPACSTTTRSPMAWTSSRADCGAGRRVPNLAAVKESSTDVRRVTAIRALIGDRLALCVGVDDAIVEGIAAGAWAGSPDW